MGYNTQLDSTKLTHLRSASYAGDHYVSFMSNRVVFAGQIATDLSAQQSWWYFNYNNVSVGSWDLVRPQQALLIGQVNDITKATYRGRARLQPNSSFVYCSESSFDFTPGAYFWVIDTHDVTYRLSRPVQTGSDVNSIIELIDADFIYQKPYPVVKGLQTGYMRWVNPNTLVARLSLDITNSYHPDPDRTIVDVQWEFYAGTYTVISGGLDQYTLVVDLEQGEQWGQVTLIDDLGNNWTREFGIQIHGPDHPPAMGLDQLTISGDLESAWSFSSTAFDGDEVNPLLDQTFTMVARKDEIYGGTSATVAPDNLIFVGWIQKESDDLNGGGDNDLDTTVKYEFVSVGARMAKVYSQLLAFTLDSNPDEWGEIKDLTWWRGIIHYLQCYTTVMVLCGVDFNDGSARDNTKLFPAITTQGGNALAVVKGICDQVNALVEFDPVGNIWFNVSYEYENDTVRGGIVPIATFTVEDIAVPAAGGLGISRTVEPSNYGIVDADGGFYNPSTAELTVITVRAPGHAQGSEPGRDTLSNQILTATTSYLEALIELQLRAGCRFNVVNNNEYLDVSMPDGYNFFTVSHRQIYLWDIDTTTLMPDGTVQRILIDTSMLWMVEHVDYTPGGNGTINIRVRFRRLSPYGDPGDNTTPPINNEVPDPTPDLGLPSFDFQWPEFTFPDIGLLPSQVSPAQLIPPPDKLATLDGQYGVVKSDTAAYLVQNYITLITPNLIDITPTDLGSFLIKHILIDQTGVTSNAIPCYLLASDGTNSAVWYSANVKSLKRTWTKGANLLGIYTILQVSKGTGKISAYCPAGSGITATWSKTFDYTLSADRTIPYNSLGIWEPSVGWEERADVDNTALSVTIPLEFSATIISVSAVFATDGVHTVGQYANISYDNTGILAQDDTLAQSPGGTLAATGLSQVVDHQININLHGGPGNWEISHLVITGSGDNPFEYDWFRYDFRLGTQGWTGVSFLGSPMATYAAGRGWQQNRVTSDNCDILSPLYSTRYAFTRGCIELSGALNTAINPGGFFVKPDLSASIPPDVLGVGPDFDADFTNVYLSDQIVAGWDPFIGSGQDMPGIYTQAVTLFTKRYWSHGFNFLTSDEGWVEDTHDGTFASWALAQGWKPFNILIDVNFNIKYTLPAPVTLIAAEATVKLEGPYNLTSGSYVSGNNPNTNRIAQLSPVPVGTETYYGAASYSGMTEVHAGLQSGLATGEFIQSVTIYGIDDDPFVPDTGDILVSYSSNRGTSFSTRKFSTALTAGGFALAQGSGVSFAAGVGGIYKSLSFGGGYVLFTLTDSATAIAIDIPTHRRNSKTSKQTTSTSPDFVEALTAADLDGGTLYFVNGINGVKTDITPVAGMTFDFSFCIATLYGTHIAVIGKVGGVYKLYITKDAGAHWTFVVNVTTPYFVAKRRNDNRPSVKTGFVGQLYLVADTGGYSSKWGNLGVEGRTLPSGSNGIDVIG